MHDWNRAHPLPSRNNGRRQGQRALMHMCQCYRNENNETPSLKAVFFKSTFIRQKMYFTTVFINPPPIGGVAVSWYSNLYKNKHYVFLCLSHLFSFYLFQDRDLSVGSLPKCPECQHRARPKSGNRNSVPILHMGVRDRAAASTVYMSGNLDQGQNSQVHLKPDILTQDAGITGSDPNSHSKHWHVEITVHIKDKLSKMTKCSVFC